MTESPKIALVLGGGAPNLTLMAGALAALDDKGVEFEVISTSGAGMLVGMLYAAPKDKTRQEALRETLELGVHDTIYQAFPINYKVFHKVGPLAEAYSELLAKAMATMSFPRLDNSDFGNFWKDSMAFWASAFSPTDPGMGSRLGLCQPAPWIDEVVDFDKLRNANKYGPDEAFQKEVLLNAYCVEDEDMVMFKKKELTPNHFRAALAFPLIYEPFQLSGKTYLEGSAIDPLNFEGLVKEDENGENTGFKGEFKGITDLIVLDVLGRDKLIREPRNLYDAWVKSMIVPLVSVADKNVKMFRRLYNGPVIARDALENPIVIKKDDGKRLVQDKNTGDIVAIDHDKKKIEKNEEGELIVKDGKKVKLENGEVIFTQETIENVIVDGYIGNLMEFDNLTGSQIVGIQLENKTYKTNNITYAIRKPSIRRRLHRIGFDIEDNYWPKILDWSRSNLKKLFDVGYESASEYVKDNHYLVTVKRKKNG
ncbi:MAG: patatin-like phospholipase family protein [Geminicoccaceae bacterium]